MKNPLINFISKYFSDHENQENARNMAAYMKTTMPFYGIRVPERRLIIKQAIKKFSIQNHIEYWEVIHQLWNQPHREEKYAAIDIARSYPYYINLDSLLLFKQMIKEGAWWDFVDDIAIHLVGTILMKSPSAMWPILKRWSNDSCLWMRRAVIICQNKLKTKTNQKYLFHFCLQRAHERDFFIKKAIGWALREYAKTSPRIVQKFLRENKEYFSTLSYKEALKNLKKSS